MPISNSEYFEYSVMGHKDIEQIVDYCHRVFRLPKKRMQIRFLDAGSSNGWLVHKLRRHGLNARGIEIDGELLASTVGKARGYNLYGNVCNIPHMDSQFDVSLATCLSYIHEVDLQKAFEELARVSRFLILWPWTIDFVERTGITDSKATIRWTDDQWYQAAIDSGLWAPVADPKSNERCLFERSVGIEYFTDSTANPETVPSQCRRNKLGHDFCSEIHVCFWCFKTFNVEGSEQCKKCGWHFCNRCRSCGCNLETEHFQVLEGLAKRFCYPFFKTGTQAERQFSLEKSAILQGAAAIIAHSIDPDCPSNVLEEKNRGSVLYSGYISANTELRLIMIAMARTFIACHRSEQTG